MIAKSPPKLHALLNKQFEPLQEGEFAGGCVVLYANEREHINVTILQQSNYPSPFTVNLNHNV